jgi:hypothetical protein
LKANRPSPGTSVPTIAERICVRAADRLVSPDFTRCAIPPHTEYAAAALGFTLGFLVCRSLSSAEQHASIDPPPPVLGVGASDPPAA